MIVMIDNYDSFTYNIFQQLAERGVELKVIRNDQITLEGLEALSPTHLIVSPGRVILTKREFQWMRLSTLLVRYRSGRLPRASVSCPGVRWKSHPCRATHAWQDLADTSQRKDNFP